MGKAETEWDVVDPEDPIHPTLMTIRTAFGGTVTKILQEKQNFCRGLFRY
jgi:hypothetical protein